MKKIFILAFIPLTLWCCTACGDKKEKEISQIQVPFQVVRLDSLFVNTPDEQLSDLQRKYPQFFTKAISDEEWHKIHRDTIYKALYKEVNKSLGDFSAQKKEIKSLFQHIKYYFPKFTSPKVVTLLTQVDYQSRVIYADSLLLIGTDNYLGEKHPYYENIQAYISNELQPQYLTVDIADAFADQIVPHVGTITFLDEMVYEGKKLYLESLLLPDKTEAQLLRYTPEKYSWAEANEAMIWRTFIEDEVLYQTDKKLLSRFIFPAPFSKFYREIDNDTPGQLGRYIGLQIVKAYVEKHKGEALPKLLAMKGEDLFKQSLYKPQK